MSNATIQQGTEAWHISRLGKCTASRVADVIAKTKSGYSTSRKNYAVELALERITKRRQEGFSSAAMAWGTEQEPNARAAYEMHCGMLVEEVGLIDHPTIPMAAASPDGLVGTRGLIEIKAPNSSTHLENLLSGKPDPRYLPQMHFQMACTGRDWVDFVSYDPRFPEAKQLFVCRVERDQNLIAELEAEVQAFLGEVETIVRKLEA